MAESSSDELDGEPRPTSFEDNLSATGGSVCTGSDEEAAEPMPKRRQGTDAGAAKPGRGIEVYFKPTSRSRWRAAEGGTAQRAGTVHAHPDKV